ncbi:unnamed protein product [Spirodela intermedia]|uniref:Uncharacterized protein n=1 Tax=Spirodela intermedia TaxID=51605 RepID=A0A7I8JJL9_SPIIN|nr:unnamed protein product [Spirodela intermedia]CAA6670366.1 unnamed protein product [Spirodela intermedia]
MCRRRNESEGKGKNGSCGPTPEPARSFLKDDDETENARVRLGRCRQRSSAGGLAEGGGKYSDLPLVAFRFRIVLSLSPRSMRYKCPGCIRICGTLVGNKFMGCAPVGIGKE